MMYLVKVRLSLERSGDGEAVMRSKDKTIYGAIPVTDQLAKLMRGRVTAFFWINQTKDGAITFEKEAPWQNW